MQTQKTITFIIRKYVSKDGKRSFFGAKAKGKYLGDLELLTPKDDETNFIVKLTQDSGLALPQKEGIYSLSLAETDDAWIDKRPDFADKPTIRIRIAKGSPAGFAFIKELPASSFDKE